MNWANVYDKLSFDLAGRHFYGRQVVQGIALGLAVTAIYGLKRYFAGGWCNVTRDLTGRNVVITGGNGGIGKETAKRLIELGANVIIGSRDMERNRQVVEEYSKIGKGKIVAFRLDLGDRASIDDFASQVKRELGVQPLHYLINNAGIMAVPERRLTKDGFEVQMGVNHFGHFYLTYLLWNKLKQSNNPRIINVSSNGHRSRTHKFDIDFYNLHYQNGDYGLMAAYSRSKKANILFTKELQSRMEAEGVNGTVVSLHPGVVRTDLANTYLNSWWKRALFILFTLPVYAIGLKSPEEGAQTTIYCALEHDDGLRKGGYYRDCKEVNTLAPQVENREAARRLWEESEKVFGIEFKI